MPGKRLWMAVLFAMALLAASAAAQEEKNEVGFIVGRTFISDQGIQNASYFDPIIHFGKGFSFAGEYAHRFWVTPIYSIAGEVVGMDDRQTKLNAGAYPNAVVPTSLGSYFITPAARVNLFPTTAVSPWISLGGGIGLDVKVWRHLSIRGEVRDFWSGEPDFPLAPTGHSRVHNYLVGGGAFWRF